MTIDSILQRQNLEAPTIGYRSIEVIFNIAAGINNATLCEQLAQMLTQTGIHARISVVERTAQIRELARIAAARSDVVVAGGGDGTVNAVASAVLAMNKVLVVLPLGTLNHFAKGMNIPSDLEAGVRAIVRGRTTRVDVGTVNSQIFLNNSSLGLYPKIVNERKKFQRLGHGKWPAFLWAAISVLRRYPFLDSLPKPQIIVPGNHDVPLHNVYARFLQPLDKYKKYITEDLEPFYVDEEMAVVGVNTARSLTIKGGRINKLQVERVKEKLCAYNDSVVKIVVTHHPFDLPAGYHERNLVGRARMAMIGLAECGADLFLAGHLHISHTGHTAVRYHLKGHVALIVQAGTTLSTRGRGEANSFNVVRIDRREIAVERFEWLLNQSTFWLKQTERFRPTGDGWSRIET